MALILVALLVTGFGLQLLSRFMQRYSVDVRRPDPLIEVSGVRRYAARPPELERLTTIVADSMSSERIAASHLGPLVEELTANAPTRPNGSHGDRRDRKGSWLAQRLTELEAVWSAEDAGLDLGPGDGASGPHPPAR